MQLRPHEIALRILEDAFEFKDGEEPYPDPRTAFEGKPDALLFLRELTEEDFGDDTVKWREWFQACQPEMLAMHYDEMARKARTRRSGGR